MEGAADIPPPLRPEPTSGRRHLRRTPFQFLNSDAFAIFFLTISLCFIFIVLISPFYSFSISFHFLKPHSARKGWDFLSLALVLFAIACGLLSKNNGENTIHEQIYRATTSNVSEQNQKSIPSTPNHWPGYSDPTDQILLHHPSEVAGIEYWRLSGGNYMANYQSLSSGSLLHCRNLQEFEEELDVKRRARATFSVYDEEISSSSSALHQFSVPPLMTPPQLSSPPRAAVEAEIERINEGDGNFEPPLLRLDFQASEDEISKTEKQRDPEGEESKRRKKKKKKKKQWKKGVENFNELRAPQHHHRNLSPPPSPPPPVVVHQYQTSRKIGETRKDFPAPPQPPPQKLISVRTQNSTGGQPPSIPLAAELQIVMEGEYLKTRNENAERKGGMFCGSPDVNSKADSFIERFRAGLKLERMNSIKERQRKTRASILGPQGPQL